MAKTRRPCLDRLAGGLALLGAGLLGSGISGAEAAMALSCTWQAPAQVAAGQPVPLAFTVRNTGPEAVDLLVWGTPFEGGWFAPFVTVSRNGKALAFGGAMLKRGDPGPEAYLHLAAGESRTASVDLAQAYDLRAPGAYRIKPEVALHDVVPAPARGPRPREQHAGQTLRCTPAHVQLTVLKP